MFKSLRSVGRLAPALRAAKTTGVTANQATAALSITASHHGAAAWRHVPMGPPDPILGLTEAYKKDTHPNKINLGVGAYRDDQGKPYVLNCVKEAERKIVLEGLDKEYSAIGGNQDFARLSAELAFSPESRIIKDGLNSTVQTISGTGALRVAANFLNRFYDFPNGEKAAYFPQPTWGNHIPIFRDSGIHPKHYRYYDPETCGLNFQGMLEDLHDLPERSVVVLHACAHNPTGVDPTADQWKEISKICLDKHFLVFFDMAYQGFASGDCERDAGAVRTFVEDGHNPIVTQSFAKNMGLYGERVGALTVCGESNENKKAIESQLKILIRPMYSNPPIHGARLVKTVLTDEKLYDMWLEEIKLMSNRINTMRHTLVENLKQQGSQRDWSHITNQIGMFCFTGLNPEQVDRLINEHHVYLTKDGRISVAGVSSHNVEHLAKAMHEVTANA